MQKERLTNTLFAATLILFCSGTGEARQVTQVDQRVIKSVAKRVNSALATKEAQLLAPLISPRGAAFVPMGIDTDLPDVDNRKEFVETFQRALSASRATCIGYDPDFGRSPDKAILYVKGLEFKPQPLPDASDLWGLLFFRDQNGLWWLVWMTPVPVIDVPDTKHLLNCGEA